MPKKKAAPSQPREPEFDNVKTFDIPFPDHAGRRILGVEVLYKPDIPVWARGLELHIHAGDAPRRRRLAAFVAELLERELPGYRKQRQPRTNLSALKKRKRG